MYAQKQSSWKENWNFDSRTPDYQAWKIRIRTLLETEGVWDIVTSTQRFDNRWHPRDQDDFIRRDKRALHLLISSLDNATVKAVGKYDRSWLVYEHLERVYAASGTVSIARARKEFISLQYEDGSDMQSHINELEDKAEVLSRLQRPIDDAEKCLQMLDSLPSTWSNLVTVCQNQESLTWPTLQAKLLLEADTRKTGTDSSKIVGANIAAAKFNEALAVANTTTVGTNGFEQRSKQRPWNNRQRHSHPYQQRSNKSSVCYYCREKGHLRRECPMKQRHDEERGETDTNKTASANVAEATREVKWGAVAIIPKVTGTILNVDQRGKATLQKQYWVLDSGATHHMTSEKSYFRTIEEMDTNVQLGDDSAVKVCGVGTAEVILQDENGGFVTLELSNCYFVPALAKNLLSVRKLRKKGIRSDLETYEDRAALKKDGITVWSVIDPNVDLYLFEHNQKNTSEVHAYVGVGQSTIELWHSRLGHLGYQNIARLVKQRSTTGIQISDRQLREFPVCDECIRANQQRASFKNTNTDHAKQVNGLVFTDLKGAIEVDSFGRKRYVHLIVDDWSGYMTVYLLRHKSEALQKFQEYVEQAENKHGRGIIGVNSDNEGEFISPAWIAYCNKKGIARRTTTPRTPEQNGSAEVRFRVLFRKVRSMLIAAQLPKQFWGEAVHAAVYVANRSPLHRSEVTPFERWHGTAPDYSLLRVFGSIAYTYVTETHAKSLQATATPGKRKTLDNRSLRGIFVGYADTQKAWRVLLCGTGEIVSTCHAIFDESNSYSTMELRQLELARLGRRLSLEYIQPSCIAASVPDLVFYAEPISDNDDSSATHDELHYLDEFIREFDVHGLQQEIVNLPDISTYNGRGGDQVLSQDKGHGSQLQALTMFAGNTLSEKQLHAEALVATENLISKMENSEISELGVLVEPKTYQAAMASADALHWRKAIDKEGQSLISHGTWKLMDLPNGKKALTSRWIFKIKYDADGNVERYKARLVIRGFEQVKYIDYDEIFAPVIRLESLRVLLALVAIMDWECHQTDVDTAFLNGDMKEEVYMLQPEGLEVPGKEDMVCKLVKALYGLKQAPRAWHKRLTDFLKKKGYEKLNSDACIYVKFREGSVSIIGIYVDDLLLISDSKAGIVEMKLMIVSEFNCKDMGEVHYILGLRICRDRDARTLSIDQSTYAHNTLKKFNLSHANPARTPCDAGVMLTKADCPQTEAARAQMHAKDYRGLVGSLMYLMTGSRPDIAFAMMSVSKYLNNPGLTHWNAAKRILRYVKGTQNYGLVVNGRSRDALQLKAFVDSDYAKDIDTRRSVSGYVMQLGECAVTYSCKSQRTVALSSTEAEYMALAHGTKEVIFLRELLRELGRTQRQTIVNVDNQSAIAVASNPVQHSRMKHIDTRYHFVRERIAAEEITTEYVNTKDNIADLLTKAVSNDVMESLRAKLGVKAIGDRVSDISRDQVRKPKRKRE